MRAVPASLAALLVWAWALVPGATAESQVFDFRDPLRVNAVAFTLSTDLQTLRGLAGGVGGTLEFDPADPAAITGTLTVETASVLFGDPETTRLAHSPGWLDVARHPELRLELGKSLALTADPGDRSAHRLVQTAILHRGSRQQELLLTLELRFLEGRAGDRVHGVEGDLLGIATSFTLDRKTLGIGGAEADSRIASRIDVQLDLIGGPPGLPTPEPLAPEPITSTDDAPVELSVRARSLLHRYDVNGDGRIAQAEFPDRMGRLFQSMDRNRDGVISAQELASLPEIGLDRPRRPPVEPERDPTPDPTDEPGEDPPAESPADE
jgi:hypothetical protein